MKDAPSADNAKKARKYASMALFALFFTIIAYLYYTGGPIYHRIAVSLVVIIVAGELILRINNFPRILYGVYMARSQLGIALMEKLAGKRQWLWNGMADWGLVMGFGLLSFIIFKKDISKKSIIFGTLSMLFILIVVLPYSSLSFAFINIPQVTSRIQSGTAAAGASQVNPIAYVIYAMAAVGGFVLYTVALIGYNAALILYGITVALFTTITSTPNYAGLNSSVPGVAPLLPGITIPFFAGILSLALILSIHEFSHGVLARIAKIKLLSSGLLMVGIIPIGGFVEPDEKKINKLSAKLQNRISAAGVASNMLLSLIMLVPMLLMFFYVMPHFYHSYLFVSGTEKSMAANVLTVNSTILMWNGYNVSNIPELQTAAKQDAAYSNVSVVTTSGSYVIKANATGKIGVFIGEAQALGGGIWGGLASFFYTFFSLTFLLSFLIALVNYLPVPSFDGWRIFTTSIRRKKYTLATTSFIVVALYINLLPWVWIIPNLGIPAAIFGALAVAGILNWLWKWSR
ncbi:MAG: site-2 protease family protein [Candidatus Micrarchaeaceae archaeon]